MFKKTCKCGKSEKNFKFDIGPCFEGDCCIEQKKLLLELKALGTMFEESKIPPNEKLRKILEAAKQAIIDAAKPIIEEPKLAEEPEIKEKEIAIEDPKVIEKKVEPITDTSSFKSIKDSSEMKELIKKVEEEKPKKANTKKSNKKNKAKNKK